jgi:hypothetical protein
LLRYGLVLALFSLLSCAAAAASPSRAEVPTLDTEGLRTIADWLRDHGRDGYIGADVADVMELPRMLGEELLAARQRGFKSDDELRIAQVPADERQDFILFMVQRPDDQVYFYLWTPAGLQKAFVSIPSKNMVVPLERLEAEPRFRREVLYWKDRSAGE